MSGTVLHISLDREARAAYLRLSSEPVVETLEVVPGMLVDVDARDAIVGIEILSPATLDLLSQSASLPEGRVRLPQIPARELRPVEAFFEELKAS